MASVFFMKYEGRRKGSSEELGTESWREAGGRWWWGGGEGWWGPGEAETLLKWER